LIERARRFVRLADAQQRVTESAPTEGMMGKHRYGTLEARRSFSETLCAK
jgi:hypothetical protein